MTISVMPQYLWFLIFTISLSALISGSAGHDSLQEECSSEFTKVTPCLGFVSGKATKPTADCCSAVKDLRTSKPACLCYFIEQTQNGTAAKGMGIQVDKLLQLPSACQLANASVSDCPSELIAPFTPFFLPACSDTHFRKLQFEILYHSPVQRLFLSSDLFSIFKKRQKNLLLFFLWNSSFLRYISMSKRKNVFWKLLPSGLLSEGQIITWKVRLPCILIRKERKKKKRKKKQPFPFRQCWGVFLLCYISSSHACISVSSAVFLNLHQSKAQKQE